jgi:hypothetical protein
MLWTVLDVFLSWVVIFCMASLVSGAFGWWLRPHKRHRYWLWAVENAAAGAIAGYFVQHPRTLLILAFAAAMVPYVYWHRRRRLTSNEERKFDGEGGPE